jgi:hypothetical protein
MTLPSERQEITGADGGPLTSINASLSPLGQDLETAREIAFLLTKPAEQPMKTLNSPSDDPFAWQPPSDEKDES